MRDKVNGCMCCVVRYYICRSDGNFRTLDKCTKTKTKGDGPLNSDGKWFHVLFMCVCGFMCLSGVLTRTSA